MLRFAYDPAIAAILECHSQLGQQLATAGPVAVTETWNRLRTDSAHHAVLWISEWPDTITDARNPTPEPLPGYRKVKSVVFCGFYPVERDDYPQLRDALEKLCLNDSAIVFEPETSVALGFGFRCGFLGLLHMDVAQERLRREYDVELVATAPNVVYEIVTKSGEVIEAHRPNDFPDVGEIEEIREPFIKLSDCDSSTCRSSPAGRTARPSSSAWRWTG